MQQVYCIDHGDVYNIQAVCQTSRSESSHTGNSGLLDGVDGTGMQTYSFHSPLPSKTFDFQQYDIIVPSKRQSLLHYCINHSLKNKSKNVQNVNKPKIFVGSHSGTNQSVPTQHNKCERGRRQPDGAAETR